MSYSQELYRFITTQGICRNVEDLSLKGLLLGRDRENVFNVYRPWIPRRTFRSYGRILTRFFHDSPISSCNFYPMIFL